MKKEKGHYSYLYGLEKYGIVLGLDNINIILSLLGNPEKKFPSIHVVGTNGKGSTTAFLTTILSKAGYKVGRYTSPHLISFTERITIGNKKISDKDVARLAFMIRDRIASSKERERPYTFFEVTTALAFQYFAEQEVDIAIIEAGLGGRLDATNVLNPLATVITNIGLEHKEFLGDTIEAIAAEKAAVIKPNTPVITAAQQDALKVIDSFGEKAKTPVFALNRDFRFQKTGLTVFDYFGIKSNFEKLRLKKLVGINQFENASLALAVIENLLNKGFNISELHLRKGLEEANWEGRFEHVRKNPPFIIDGAHNPHGVQSLINNLSTFHPSKAFVIILNVLRDKDIVEMVNALKPFAELFVLVPNKNERSHTIEEYQRLFDGEDNFLYFKDIPSALKEILFSKRFEKKPVLFTGSLYGVGEAKEYLKKHQKKLC